MAEDKDLVLLEKTEFYESLSEKEKKVYELHFRNPKLEHSEIAKLARCGKTTVNKFFARPKLKEEMSAIFLSRLHSPEMLEIIDKTFSLAKEEKGFKDRDKLLNLLLSPLKKKEKETDSMKTVIEIINKDKD